MKNSSKPLEQLREETLKLLESNFTHDVISVEEYEKRVDIALNTSTGEDLIRLSGDLVPLAGQQKPASPRPVRHSKQKDLIVGILSGIRRRGRWNPAKHNKIITVLGGVKLDFTEVQMPDGTTTLEFFCLMGGLDIIVPDDVRVDVSGLPIMGSIENRVSDPEDPNCPVLKIRGITLLGGVEVKPPRKRRRGRRNR
ncbi:MAG: DUF1707 and DUF2154 domain-containing protein [Spirochaetes bacterium]|nr:DUF1707 and DUF2154 domain-containing protein [Spirochaetota bacterium]